MTFKHTKFEDSPVMRSLEKIAKKKALVKNDILQKIASTPAKSKKVDLKPTNNLTENLLKLCAGLREAGMNKYAEELESTFMKYKQASCECDHDMVDKAHPKGSHKLEGVVGDAVIETILDQHLAIMKVVEKKPIGKLSTAEDIINSVKKSLIKKSQVPPQNIDNPTEDELILWRKLVAFNKIDTMRSILETLNNKVNTEISSTTTLIRNMKTNYTEIKSTFNQLSSSSINDELVLEIIGDLKDMINSLNLVNWKDISLFSPLTLPLFVTRHLGDITDAVLWNYNISKRNELEGYVERCLGIANASLEILRGDNDNIVKEEMRKSSVQQEKPSVQQNQRLSVQQDTKSDPLSSNFEKYFQKINNLLSQLSSWKNIKTISENKEASDWINEEISVLTEIYDKYQIYIMSSFPEDQIHTASLELAKQVNNEAHDIDEFKSDWIE